MTAFFPQGGEQTNMASNSSNLPSVYRQERDSRGPGGRSSFDFAAMLSSLRRRLPLLLIVATVVFGAALIYTLMQRSLYEATAQLEVDSRLRDAGSAVSVGGRQTLEDVGPETAGLVDTEVQLVGSPALAGRVVDDLKLQTDPEFGGPGKTRDETTAELMDATKVARTATTYLIDIIVRSEDPRKAARIANSYARNYLVMQIDRKVESAEGASKDLEARVAQLASEVEAAEGAVQRYRIANNLLSVQGATLAEGTISTLEQQRDIARAREAEVQGRLAAARAQLARSKEGNAVGAAATSPVVQSLLGARATTAQQVADMNSRLGPQHPDFIKARDQLAAIDRQIQSEVGRVVNNLEAEAVAARQSTASLSTSAGRTQSALMQNNRALVDLNSLERRAESARVIYNAFLNRSNENQSAVGLQQPDARISSLAAVPVRPTIPNKKANLALGAILALAAGVSAAVIATALDNRLSTASDIENYFDLRALPAIPAFMSTISRGEAGPSVKPAAWIIDNPSGAFAESFRNLRAAIRRNRRGEPNQVIAITSALPGEGKTTTSICLGRIAALAGDRVLVVDCDLRRRSLKGFTGTEVQYGLLEVLAGEATLEQAMLRDEATGAMFLPIAKSEVPLHDFFGSPAMLLFLQQARRHFDLIILDAAPVLPVADTRILASQADRVVMLARWRKTPRKAIEASLQILSSAGGRVTGLALTRVDLRTQAREGFGDPTFYYGKYCDYYS